MIENDQQLENTRRKRAMLQEALDETQNDTDNENSNAYVRELTLRSLKRRICLATTRNPGWRQLEVPAGRAVFGRI